MVEIYREMLSDETATESFADAMARMVKPGDLLALSGDLGAGKTTFARAFIRVFCHASDMEVPSPTFTLVQTYSAPDGTVVFHSDLYRLKGPDEIEDLGLEDEREDAVLLVEWPDRMPADWWQGALKIELEHHVGGPESGRRLVVTSESLDWQRRLTNQLGPQV